MNYSKSEFVDYIVEFIHDYGWESRNIPQTIKSFFTTWAFLFHIEADTYDCDTALRTIYDGAQLSRKLGYDEFENFMVGLIV